MHRKSFICLKRRTKKRIGHNTLKHTEVLNLPVMVTSNVLLNSKFRWEVKKDRY